MAVASSFLEEIKEKKRQQGGVSQYDNTIHFHQGTGNPLTYTVLNATWTAALRTLTATTGFRTRTAASNGSKKRFS